MVKVMDRRIGAWLAHAVIVCLGLLSAVWCYEQFISPVSPIVYDRSAIYPTKAKAGDWIEVTREFTVNRAGVVVVTRRLINGDCKHACVAYDIDSSSNYLTVGKYNRTRIHQLPRSVKPGVYTLDFQVQWTNTLGKEFAASMPPLSIEIVP